jgi:hypothetical protein
MKMIINREGGEAAAGSLSIFPFKERGVSFAHSPNTMIIIIKKYSLLRL